MNVELPVLLTVRGTLLPSSPEAARKLHNETAGSPPGIAAARSLGDLSHHVFTPVKIAQSNAEPGELLFLDVWADARGIMEFFSNPEVHGQASRLFTSKDATVWMPARGAFTYHLNPVRGKDQRFVGMVRGPIASPEAAIATFAAADAKSIRDARRRGILSHEVFIKVSPPEDRSPLELLAVDTWSDPAGMAEHYGDKEHMQPLGAAFAGRPAASVWEQAAGSWSEW